MIRQWYAKLVFTIAVLVVSIVAASAAATQTFTGIVSDTMCGAKHMLPGNTDAECTRECVKGGASYALVVDKHVYTLSGSTNNLSRSAGKRVQITGERTGDTIKVQSVTVVNQ